MIRRALPLLLTLLAAAPAVATTFLPMTDEELFDRSAAVAEVRVITVESAPGRGRPATDYLVEVERLLAGDLPGTAIVVRVLGGVRPDGVGLHIWGAPRFREEDRALLFLEPRNDGTYQVEQFLLGAFHRVEAGAATFAVRDLREASVLGGENGHLELRDWDRFVAWAADRAARVVRAPDYFVEANAADLSSIGAQFTLFEDGGLNMRWQEFGFGQSVPFSAHSSGQEGVAGGGFAELQRAIDAWVSDSGSDVLYRYGGTTNATAGFSHNDGTTAILFNDPHNDIGEPYNCSSGTLAIGGPWYSTGPRITHLYRGTEYYSILEADIVTAANLGCFFQASINPSKVAEELFSHEMGHTLGLSHSSERRNESNPLLRDALMYYLIHDDGRGARLNSDDRAAIATLYPAGGGGTSLRAPSNLGAALAGRDAILTWRDNSSSEEGFRIYRRRSDGNWAVLASVAANTTTYTDRGLETGFSYSYRVAAYEGTEESGFSNAVTVALTCEPPADPGAATAVPTSASSLQVDWTDLADDEVGYQVDLAPGSQGAFAAAATLAADATSVVLTGLAASTEYRVRIAALGDGGCSSDYATAHGWTPGDDPAPPAAPDQLLGILQPAGEILVTWRDNSDNELDFQVERRAQSSTEPQAGDWEPVATLPLDGSTRTPTARLAGHEPGSAYTFRVRSRGVGGVSDYSPEVTVSVPAAGGTCAVDSTTACLLGGRFQARAQWRKFNQDNVVGTTQAVGSLGDRTSTFAFFNPDVTDLLVKALDGRPVNGSYWIFYGALSNVEYWITVTDTLTGEVASYYNDPGQLCGVPDVDAFPGASPAPTGTMLAVRPAAAPTPSREIRAAEGTCVADDQTLCLRDGRFQVRVSWEDERGNAGSGVGRAVPGSNDSGFFWFFRSDNTELAVKVLDGTPVNGYYWVLFGALSDVHYEVTVTDTQTGVSKLYVNEQGSFCGQHDTAAF